MPEPTAPRTCPQEVQRDFWRDLTTDERRACLLWAARHRSLSRQRARQAEAARQAGHLDDADRLELEAARLSIRASHCDALAMESQP